MRQVEAGANLGRVERMLAKPSEQLGISALIHCLVHAAPARVPVVAVNVADDAHLGVFTPWALVGEAILIQVITRYAEAGKLPADMHSEGHVEVGGLVGIHRIKLFCVHEEVWVHTWFQDAIIRANGVRLRGCPLDTKDGLWPPLLARYEPGH